MKQLKFKTLDIDCYTCIYSNRIGKLYNLENRWKVHKHIIYSIKWNIIRILIKRLKIKYE